MSRRAIVRRRLLQQIRERSCCVAVVGHTLRPSKTTFGGGRPSCRNLGRKGIWRGPESRVNYSRMEIMEVIGNGQLKEHADPVKSAKLVGLRYVTDEMPGF